MKRSSYRSDETFLTKEIPKGVQHAEEVKVAADRNEQIKANNLTEEPESISSQTSPSPAPASTSTSEGDKDGIHKSHSDGKRYVNKNLMNPLRLNYGPKIVDLKS